MGILDALKSLRALSEKGRSGPDGAIRIFAFGMSKEANLGETGEMAIPDSSMHAKKRRYPRYIVDGMGIHAHMLFTDEVELDNLSVAGACIRTRRDLKVGCKYLLKIPDRKTSLYIGCTVTWKREYAAAEDRPQGYKAGLQFLNISSDEIIRLKDFMRTTGVPDERRASDRYRVSPLRYYLSSKEIAVLKCPEMLNVKKISLGGMLIGSDCTMDLEGTCLIKILLSSEVDPIKCRGRIASLSPSSEKSRQQFDIGVEFLSMEDTDRTRLDGFISSL